MTDADCCAECGHRLDQHQPVLGYCEAAGCPCMEMVFDDEDEPGDDVADLNFDDQG